MIRTVLLVPIRDNDGQPFPRASWDGLEDRLLSFGGFTVRENVTGVWRSAGHVYRDQNREYTVSLRSWLHLHDWLQIVLWARIEFRQIAMYIEVAGVPEILE